MARELWHAEIEVDENLAKDCITAQFPELLPIVSLTCLGEGWDNVVFLINERHVFRFPRRHIAVPLIERENKVLASLKSCCDLNLPNPIYQGHSCDRYPYPFHGYEIIPGIPGYEASLTNEDRENSLPAMACFLKQCHQIDAEQAYAIGAETQVFDRTDKDRILPQLTERVNKIIEREVCSVDLAVLDEEITIAKAVTLSPKQVLVHGDLHCRHLMFENKQLTGIIDWGDMGINNPAVDFMIIFSFFPPSCHAEFLKIYGDVDTEDWKYARFLSLYSSFSLMVYGADMGDQALTDETIAAVRRVNSRLIP